MGRLDGKVALITGAGAGMGREAAILFAQESAKVVVNDCIEEAGMETLRIIGESIGNSIFVKGDVSKREDWQELIQRTITTYGKLDVLYNNAAVAIRELFIESTEEIFEKTIAINVKGTWLGMKYAIPEMIKAGGGSIINVSSTAADSADIGSAIYAASKGAVMSMSRVAAIEHAVHNIRVNVIKPGGILTYMFEKYFKDNTEAMDNYLSKLPLHRFGKPEEVARLALFLASDESSLITGQKLTIDGGITADSRMT